MLIQIDGWWGSGKSVLRGLLDGHPDVFSSPLHELLLLTFRKTRNNTIWLKNKDIQELRSLLTSNARYYMIERFAYNGKVHFDFSANDRVYVDFNFDFYNMDRLVAKTLFELDEWHPENIIETFYQAFGKTLYGNSYMPKYYASMGHPLLEHLKNFKNLFPKGKFIYIDRSVESIIATRANRKVIPEDFRSAKGHSKQFTDLIENNEVEKILTYRNKVLELKDHYPNDFLIVKFDDLVTKTKPAMERVANFLNIPFEEEILLKFSFLGEEITCNSKKYIGEELDKPEELLSPQELEIIRQRIHNFFEPQKRSNHSSDISVQESFLKRTIKQVPVAFRLAKRVKKTFQL